MQLNEIRKKTRLGRLLIEKGLVSAEQLAQAVDVQRDCRTTGIGQILVQRGVISGSQLGECLREQAHVRVFRETRLGNLLVERGLVDKRQLDDAIREQKGRQGQTLGQILVEQGILSDSQLRSCLRHQSYLRLSAAVLALSITPFQAAFADRSPTEGVDSYGAVSYMDMMNAAERDLATDDSDLKVYEGGAAVEKMVGVAAKIAWRDLGANAEINLLDNSSEEAQPMDTAYKVGLSSSGVRLSSFSQGRFSTSTYKMLLSSSGDIEVNYTIRF